MRDSCFVAQITAAFRSLLAPRRIGYSDPWQIQRPQLLPDFLELGATRPPTSMPVFAPTTLRPPEAVGIESITVVELDVRVGWPR